MNKPFIIAALVLALASSAHAANRTEFDSDFHVAANLGLTAGGDSIAKVKFTNGDNVSIHGGGLIQLGAGVYYKPSLPISALLTINYHFDSAYARNGNVKFERWPLELIGYYHINESWRVGAGIRHVMNAKLKFDIDNDPITNIDYADTNSPVFEAAWGQQWGRSIFWVGVRYVHETLKVQRIGDAYANFTEDGSHVGLFARYAY